MGSRRQVLDTLQELSFGAELLGDRRARSYGAAWWALRQAGGDLAELSQSGAITDIKGVGKSTAKVVAEVLAGQEPESLLQMKQKLPAGLFELRRIKGLGAKKVRRLWNDLGITSLAELEYACRENRLVKLDGFGSKTQAQVLDQIAMLRERVGKLRRDVARALVEASIATLEELPEVERVAVVGDYPRGKELVEGVELLVAGDHAGAELDERVRVHRCSLEGFGWAQLRLTASEGHLAALAERAEERGVELDDLDTEEDIYFELGLHPTPPERREDQVPVVEVGSAGPRLIQRSDLRGAVHNHTTESDGSASLEEMRDAAAARGLEYLGITEHSVTASYARGLEVPRLLAQLKEIEQLNASSSVCVVLSGVESDILSDGSLDYEQDVLAKLEIVVASAHRRYARDREATTQRMIAAASHPMTTLIGHPTGRLLLGRPPAEIDMEAFLEACATSGCAVELNASPARLDLNEDHLAMAKQRGVPISIAADAHAVGELDYLDYGISIARRAGLRAEDVLNTRSLSELREWLVARRQAITAAP